MKLFGGAQSVKDGVKVTSPGRVVGVLAGGSLGQRVVALLGLGLMIFAVFEILKAVAGYVAFLALGWVLCLFSVLDYEKTADDE